MTDDFPQGEEHDDEDLDAIQMQGFREEVREARKIRRDYDKLQMELVTERSERAYSEAGVGDTGPAKWFRKGYDGPMEAAAIRAAAIEDGILPPAEEDERLDAELAAQRRMAQGIREGGEPPPDPHAALQGSIRGAKTEAELLETLNQAQRDGVPGVRIKVQGEGG